MFGLGFEFPLRFAPAEVDLYLVALAGDVGAPARVRPSFHQHRAPVLGPKLHLAGVPYPVDLAPGATSSRDVAVVGWRRFMVVMVVLTASRRFFPLPALL